MALKIITALQRVHQRDNLGFERNCRFANSKHVQRVYLACFDIKHKQKYIKDNQ